MTVTTKGFPPTPPFDRSKIVPLEEVVGPIKVIPNCAKCNDSGLLNEKGKTYCGCKRGHRLAEEGMMAGEHGL